MAFSSIFLYVASDSSNPRSSFSTRAVPLTPDALPESSCSRIWIPAAPAVVLTAAAVGESVAVAPAGEGVESKTPESEPVTVCVTILMSVRVDWMSSRAEAGTPAAENNVRHSDGR